MIKVYAGPEHIKAPDFLEFKDWSFYEKDQERYLNEMREFCKEHSPNQKYVGETIDFPVADGKAVYMVCQMSPTVEVIHLEIGDAWHFEYVHRLTREDVIEQIESAKRLAEFFAKNKKG